MIRVRGLAAGGLALVLVTTAASAQAIGFKLGPTFSTISVNDESTEQSNLLGFGGGGFLRFALAGLSIQPEVLALSKGANVIGADIPGELKLKLDYIEVPVFVRFGLSRGLVEPYLLIGPSFSFETRCTGEFDNSGSTLSTACQAEADATTQRKKTDLGGAAALGVEFRQGPGSLVLEGRYTHGFTDIAKSPTEQVRNRMFGIFAGYLIRLRTNAVR